MTLPADKSFKMKMRDVENAFKYRRIPYPKRSVELIALLAISCTFFLFMHTNKLNSRLKEMEVKLQPSEFSALGLTGDNHISSRDGAKHDINTLHGTYQYLKSTGQLEYLTPESLNNTATAQTELVFFNRVPKAGSQTLMELIKVLAKSNAFEALRDKPQYVETVLMSADNRRALIEDIVSVKTPLTFSKHVAFIDFEAMQYPRPIYINVVRHPIERLVSWFYYIRAPWYIAQRKLNFPDTFKLPSVPWLRKDFDSCIEQQDPECVFTQGQALGVGDHRRQMLFFCGQTAKICMPFNSYEAMQLAKRNVELHYAVVGTWEETNLTLSVLEYYVPRFFAGATDAYYKDENHLQKVNRNMARPSISTAAREILSRNLTNEIEFYQFCKQRLYKQYIARQFRKAQQHDGNEVKKDERYNSPRYGWNRKRESHRLHDRFHRHQDHHRQPHGYIHRQHEHGSDHEHENERDSAEKDDQDNPDDYTDEYDDQYLKRLDVLNNTKKAEIDMVFFNRVPKVGSQSLMELMIRLGKVNGFQHWRDTGKAHETVLLLPEKQRALVTLLVAHKRPQVYSQHIAFLNFTRFHMPKPIYINLVRDPIERVISWHYYYRAEWYYKEMKARLGDKAPKMPSKEFMEMDLDTCVRTNNINCQFIQMQVRNPSGDHRRQSLFFCGQNHKTCMPFNSKKAIQKAKRTVEEEYAVVGTWDDTNITLTVLEHYIPKYFRNAKVAYYLGKDHLSKVNRNSVKGSVSDETREILRKNFTMEIEFYEFCKQRLYLQYAAINNGGKIDTDDYLMIPEKNGADEDY